MVTWLKKKFARRVRNVIRDVNMQTLALQLISYGWNSLAERYPKFFFQLTKKTSQDFQIEVQSVLISLCKYFDAGNISIWQIIISWPDN